MLPGLGVNANLQRLNSDTCMVSCTYTTKRSTLYMTQEGQRYLWEVLELTMVNIKKIVRAEVISKVFTLQACVRTWVHFPEAPLKAEQNWVWFVLHPSVGRWRQVDPWGSLISQLRILGEFRPMRMSQKKKKSQGVWHLRNKSQGCTLALALSWMYMHTPGIGGDVPNSIHFRSSRRVQKKWLGALRFGWSLAAVRRNQGRWTPHAHGPSASAQGCCLSAGCPSR